MTTRALVVGRDGSEIEVLTDIARVRVGPDCEVIALELDTTSVDPDLAWGTAMPHLRPIDRCADTTFLGDQPLPEDGTTWKAILAAAEHSGAEVIVIARRPQSWLGRVLLGSAANDLVEHSDRPVVVVDVERGTVEAKQPNRRE
jgi:hypothetical protein